MSNSKHTIIKLRRGTAAEWAASEPQPGGEVLKLGEPGYEKDTGKLKIGDGVTPWNSLGYVAGGTILVEDIDHLISEVIQAGDGIQLNFDDANDTLTIAADNIVNSGNNRVLTSDGTSTGIEGEPALTFDGYRLRIDCDCPTGTAGLTVVGDQRSTSIVSNVYGDPRSIETEDGISIQRDTSRIILTGSRGTEASPSGLEVEDVIFIIRGDAYNPYGTLNAIGNPENRSTRILGRVTNSGISYLGSSLEFQTTSGSGSGIWDNSMLFDHTGSLKINTVPVSLSGHTHQYSDITDFSDGVESVVDTLLVAGTGISLSYDGGTNSLTISSTGSGGGASTIAAVDWTANHTLVDGTRYLAGDVVYSGGIIYRAQFDNESIPVTDGVYWENLGAGYRLNIDGRDIQNIPYPVEDIVAGTGISIGSVDGVYTITSTGSGVLADQASSIVTTVFNETGSPIPKMTAVYIDGGHGDRPTVSLALATGDPTSAGTYGVTLENIDNMELGQVIVFGALTGVNTDPAHGGIAGATDGSTLYLSPTTPGGLTTTKPSAPNHMVVIGTVVRVHQNQGVIEVRIQNGFELDELHNVAISGVTDGQFLQYNSSSQLWVPSSSGNFTSINADNAKFTQLYPTVISSGNVSGYVITDVGLGQIFDLTLIGATTLGLPASAVDGVTIRWRITQDGTGGHAVSLDTGFVIPSSASSPLPWSTAPNTTDILAATYHAGRDKWDVVAFVPGY